MISIIDKNFFSYPFFVGLRTVVAGELGDIMKL
jgi:hypothetical protein